MEKREHTRMPIDIQITLKEVNSAYDIRSINGESIIAKAIDLSASGIGFIANVVLHVGTSYSAKIIYEDFNPFIITLQVQNRLEDEQGTYKYGCTFEGNIGHLNKTTFFKALYHSLYP